MDARRFDQLVAALTSAGSRRGLLQRLAAVPLFGGLAVLVGDDETEAGRRKRRKRRQKRARNTRRTSRKRQRRQRRRQKRRGQIYEVHNGSDLHAAVMAAVPNSTLIIHPGTFGPVVIDKNLTLIGAGAGTDPTSNTILDGGGSGSVVTVAPGATVTLKGKHIPGGNAQMGGGILNQGTLIVSGCTIVQNAASEANQGQGGGIANISSGVATITGSTIASNSAFYGGGIYQESSKPLTLDQCIVQQNNAVLGGGVVAGFGAVAINNGTTIIGNTAEDFGGGITVLANGTVTFDATCRLTGNDAESGLGGGIYNQGGVTLNGALVCGNTPSNSQCTGSFSGACPNPASGVCPSG